MAGEPARSRRTDPPRDADLERLAADLGDAKARAALATRLRREYDAGSSVRVLAARTRLAYADVRRLLDESAPAPARSKQEADAAQARVRDLASRGAVVPPDVPKGTPPEPLVASLGLSDLVIAQRG